MANLRQHPSTAPPGQASPSTTRTATGRLEELKTLLDRGLVTQAEYDERRKAIIDSV